MLIKKNSRYNPHLAHVQDLYLQYCNEESHIKIIIKSEIEKYIIKHWPDERAKSMIEDLFSL